jgi:hypothetical protein
VKTYVVPANAGPEGYKPSLVMLPPRLRPAGKELAGPNFIVVRHIAEGCQMIRLFVATIFTVGLVFPAMAAGLDA